MLDPLSYCKLVHLTIRAHYAKSMLNFKAVLIDFYGYFKIIIEVMLKPYEVW